MSNFKKCKNKLKKVLNLSKGKKFVEKVTAMEDDFGQWYTDVVKQADLVDYGSVRGTMIIKPYGFALWENIRDELDRQIKETGHTNVSFPLLIPESLLQKEKDHVEGFSPEVAWVTHAGDEELAERLVIRPTSEVLFCEYYSNNIHSRSEERRVGKASCSNWLCTRARVSTYED